MHKPLLIAHRGDTRNYPENTLEAFESAFAQGAGGVEMDVQLADGKIRVVHDYLYDSVKEYPLFEHVLQKVGDLGRLEIEVKAFSTTVLKPLQNLLQSYSPRDIEITTSELPMVAHIKQMFPRSTVGVIFDTCHYKEWMSEEIYLRKTVELMHLMSAQVVHLSNLPIERLTVSLVTSLHKKGLKTHYHIAAVEMREQLALYNHLQSIGISQCTIDYIDLLLALRKTQNPS